MRGRIVISAVVAALGTSALVVSSHAMASPPAAAGRAEQVAAYWTPERVASAQPRDLVMDEHGNGYLRGSDGSLTPRGRTDGIRLAGSTPMAKSPSKGPSGGGSDTTAPSITDWNPTTGQTITATDTDVIDFSALITDDSGIRSVSVVIHLPSGSTQSFSASSLGGGRWGTSLKGFAPGGYTWDIIAKDAAPGGGNTATEGSFAFTVVAPTTGGPDGTGTTTVTKAQWPKGGAVQQSAGRILFEMPTEVRRGRKVTIEWNAYVCSGTVVTDTRTDASIILTAAHCVYDDAMGEFADNVLFIPNQDDGGTDRTDSNCDNDPFGCWAPTYGVVDSDYTATTFPGNNAWDYGFYVVPNDGAHSGTAALSSSLEEAVGTLDVGFNAGQLGDVAHALGYSYADDPKFMYCAEPLGQYSSVNWMLPSCELTGGSSGGPWVQPMDESTGAGPIISVNSWGYTTKPGMAGPKLGDEAACTFETAVRGGDQTQPRGVVARCP